MASLKEIRTRISSIRSTRQITSAMKMVAASRLRKAQNNIIHLRSYSKTLKYLLSDVMQRLPPSYNNLLLQSRDNPDVLLITIGSDKGLCGTYNTMLIKRTLQEVNNLQNNNRRVKIIAIGNKPWRFLDKRGYELIPANIDNLDKLSYETSSEFAKYVIEVYLKENFSHVIIVYNRFRNAVIHELTTEQVLPIPENDLVDIISEEEISDDRIILEPTPDEVIDYMTEQYVNYNFYRIMLDAAASEHGSRMTAMHQATDNADAMLKTLSLSYNKARQAAVTRELIDIVGGAERRS